MKYILSPNVRIRFNVEKSFFVDISINKVTCISTDAMLILRKTLKNGLSAEEFETKDENLKKFILSLCQMGIIIIKE